MPSVQARYTGSAKGRVSTQHAHEYRDLYRSHAHCQRRSMTRRLRPHSHQPPSPFLTAASCFLPTSVTKSGGGGGESDPPTNCSVTKPRPSVNINAVTLFEPSGDVPDNRVPPVPTVAASVFGSLTRPCPVFAEFSALAAAAASGRTWMVSTI